MKLRTESAIKGKTKVMEVEEDKKPLLIGDPSTSSVLIKHFVIREKVHQKILSGIRDYIHTRGQTKSEEPTLNWVSQVFRKPQLTKAKLVLANQFLNAAEKTRDYDELQTLVAVTMEANKRLEKENEKNYTPFTKSKLLATLDDIYLLLDKEEKRIESLRKGFSNLSMWNGTSKNRDYDPIVSEATRYASAIDIFVHPLM